MRTLRTLAVLAVAAAALPVLAGVAHALVPPTGPTCSMLTGPDPTAEVGRMFGTVAAGPLVAASTTMTVTCSIQVGGTGVHSDPDVGSVSAGPSANAVTLVPALVAYQGDPNLATYLCTHVHQVDGLVPYDLYWDDPSQSWSLNPLTAHCAGVPQPAAPVDGGVVVSHHSNVLLVQPFGVLDNAALWTCSVPTYTPATPFTVTCTPVSSTVPWTCASVITGTLVMGTGVARTSLDCDGSSPPESQTATVTNTTMWDYDAANTTLAATTFSCTLDDGGTSGPTGDFAGFCADPGLGSV